MPKPRARTIFTIGHSTRSIDEFVELLRESAVDLLVDVRSVPRSRTNPQFNEGTLPDSLAAAGITYVHLSALGGLRHRRKSMAPSPNTLWRNESFRNYADYASTAAFGAGFDKLRALARDHCCAIMCAEAVWWRCHRRIIADYLLADGIPVVHIMGLHKADPATLTPGAQVLRGGSLQYSAAGDEPRSESGRLLANDDVG